MPRPNLFQTFTHCWRYAMRRALADGDTFHIIAIGATPPIRIVLSDRELFARDDLAPEDVEASVDPFLPGFGAHGRE